MSRTYDKARLGLLGFVLIVATMSSMVAARGVIASLGASQISFPSGSTASVAAGNSVIVSYVVTLTNGTAKTTDINVVNAKALAANGITVIVYNSGGFPTYNGTLKVSAAANTVSGAYQVWLNASNGDPAPQTSLTLNVGAAAIKPPTNTTNSTKATNSTKTTNTTTTTSNTPTTGTPKVTNTTTSTNATNATGTSSTTGSSATGGNTIFYIGIVVVVIIIIIAAWFLMKRK